jgi:hypothetical protein
MNDYLTCKKERGTTMKQIKHWKKGIAIFLCICLISVLSLSYFFIVTHERHHCTGKNCTVCEQLQIAEQIIGQMKFTILTAVAVLFAYLFLCEEIHMVSFCIVINTPVKQKVRMNH